MERIAGQAEGTENWGGRGGETVKITPKPNNIKRNKNAKITNANKTNKVSKIAANIVEVKLCLKRGAQPP